MGPLRPALWPALRLAPWQALQPAIKRAVPLPWAQLKRRSLSTLPEGKHEAMAAKTLAGQNIDPWHGSYHWIYERALSVASLGLVATAMAVEPSRSVDMLLGIVLPLHCHVGFAAIITDYVPLRKFPAAYRALTAALYGATALTIYGLFLFNTKDVGLSEGVGRLWRAARAPPRRADDESD